MHTQCRFSIRLVLASSSKLGVLTLGLRNPTSANFQSSTKINTMSGFTAAPESETVHCQESDKPYLELSSLFSLLAC